MQLKIRRQSPPRHQRAKQALIAAAAIGLTAESVRRLRNRKHTDEASVES